MTEVYEVATFYHHFDVVKEGEEAPPRSSRCACARRSPAGWPARSSCSTSFRRCSGPNVRVIAAPCIGRCAEAPAVCVGQNAFGHASANGVEQYVKHGKRSRRRRCSRIGYAEYRAQGGYKTWVECVGGKRDVDAVIKAMEDAGLRGLGGAGFPAGRKWKIVRAEPGPRLMAVNIDEGEPGTFKDRHYLERDPHRFLEGMLDRRVGRRHRGHLRLPARRVSRVPRDARARARRAEGRSSRAPFRASTCAAAPAPTSAAKSPR